MHRTERSDSSSARVRFQEFGFGFGHLVKRTGNKPKEGVSRVVMVSLRTI